MSRAKRSTRPEMIAKLEERLAILQAQQAGDYAEDTSSDSFQIKMIRKALRRRGTLLHRAGVVLNGKPATATTKGGKTIAEDIERLEARLADRVLTQANAVEQEAKLPFDIETLQRIVDAYDEAEDKSEVDTTFPDLLVKVNTDPTEAEAELEASMEGSEHVTITADDVGVMDASELVDES